MFHRHLLKTVFGSLIVLGALLLPACQSTGGTEALTGRSSDKASPRFEPHGKGANWGHVVYDR